MNIWILQTGEPLHSDKDFSRGMRGMNLADKLIEKGHNVIFWSAAFNHTKKNHRASKFTSIKFNNFLTINLIPSPGYKKNISLKRFIDHIILAINLNKILRDKSKLFIKPDAIFVGFPPIETSFVMLKWASENNIPTVIDVKDQWPIIFIDKFPKKLKKLAQLLFYPQFYLTKKIFNISSLHCSMTSDYLSWMSKIINNSNKKGIVVPLTSKKIFISENEIKKNFDWFNQRNIDLKIKRRIIFVGSFSNVFDFNIVFKLVEYFNKTNVNCQFVFCGIGVQEEKLKIVFNNYSNVIFPGWIDQYKLQLLALSSNALIAPYKNTGDFTNSIPNKILDALSYGLPIITTLDGKVRNLLEKYQIGYFINDNNFNDIIKEIIKILDDDNFFNQLSKNSTKLYSQEFDYEKVYDNLVFEIENLVN